jgi:hypothetical protein
MEEKLKLLQEMASSESDIRDGNIGSFSQGVVVGERNASRLALEIIESIKRGDKEPYICSPIYKTNMEDGLIDFFSKPADKPKAFSWKPDSTRSMG